MHSPVLLLDAICHSADKDLTTWQIELRRTGCGVKDQSTFQLEALVAALTLPNVAFAALPYRVGQSRQLATMNILVIS